MCSQFGSLVHWYPLVVSYTVWQVSSCDRMNALLNSGAVAYGDAAAYSLLADRVRVNLTLMPPIPLHTSYSQAFSPDDTVFVRLLRA